MIDLIIPLYNAKKTLDLTLMSIKMQTIVDKLNIYLIDDCSDDDYDEILNNYKDMNIIYKKLDKNSGPAVARQEGIQIGTSKYIMFMDADDLFYNTDSIKKLYETIEEGYDYVAGLTYEEKRQIKLLNESDLHGKIYKRKFIEDNKIRFNKTRFHEDNYYNNLVLLCEPKRKELLELVYIYVYNEDSITNDSKEKEFERLEIYISNLNELIQEAKRRNIRKELIVNLIETKINYFNRIWLNFTQEQRKIFKEWLKKYNLNIEKYINDNKNTNIYEELLKEFGY